SSRVNSKIVVTCDHSGQAIHQDPVSALWTNVENDVPTRADGIVGPVVMAHHDAVIFRITSGRHNRAAVTRRMRGWSAVLLLFQPGNVVVRKLFERVESDNVPAVSLNP